MHPNVKALLKVSIAAQKSEEWLALRGNMLTASDAATSYRCKNIREHPKTFYSKNAVLGKSLPEMQPLVTVRNMRTKLVFYMKRGTGK